ncbi:ATP-grasp domain-containing protein [Streptomyces atroolivaceus]|uniref:ATP-grasp domain-containing protein n=1 Tax=Streptomyces atroolivaceus TaxID=66869 RepID=UPI0020250328|nr:ATP-grasp domain-containing protein [Streptomyces atroolivaceus]
MADLLALAPHRSTTATLLAGAARERGMDVTVLPRHGLPARPPEGARAHYYGGPLFGASAAGRLGIALLEPDEGWLDALPYAFTGRRVRRVPLSEARHAPGPLFAKPPTDKSFPAAVYADGAGLRIPTGPQGDPVVQISEVVTWVREFRLHLLDGEIRTGSQYACFGRLDVAPLDGHADEPAVRAFAGRLAEVCAGSLPSGVVLDVGLMRAEGDAGEGRWAVVEASMAWFSNLYAADPARALDVVLRAAGPCAGVRARDAPFRRAWQRGPATPAP